MEAQSLFLHRRRDLSSYCLVFSQVDKKTVVLTSLKKHSNSHLRHNAGVPPIGEKLGKKQQFNEIV